MNSETTSFEFWSVMSTCSALPFISTLCSVLTANTAAKKDSAFGVLEVLLLRDYGCVIDVSAMVILECSNKADGHTPAKNTHSNTCMATQQKLAW